MNELPLYNSLFESYYNDFNRMTQTKGYASAKYMASCLREFLFFIETKGIENINNVKATDIFAYHHYLNYRPNQRRSGGLSDTTIKAHLFSLRVFFDYLVDTSKISCSPTRLPKFSVAESRGRNIATIDEIKQIYSTAETMYDKSLLGLAYGCGLRRSEIARLNTFDIDFHKGMLTVRSGKLGKTRTIPISDNVLKDFKNYMIYERSTKVNSPFPVISPAFLINRNTGDRVYSQSLNDRVRQLVLKTGNLNLIKKNITLHCLRHSIATHLLDNGASIEFVQKFLGHQLLDTTHIYSKRRKQKQVLQEAIYRSQL